MRIIDIPQVLEDGKTNPEWLQARSGRVTASCISDVMAKKTTASYRDYMYQIVSEILTGKYQGSSYENEEMRWGKEQEPFARGAYTIATDQVVGQIGLAISDKDDRWACSPDGLVGTDGLIEIKCPKTSTHLITIMENKIPSKYIDQMYWQMFVCDRTWDDFVSFDPRVSNNLQLFKMRLMRDDNRIKELKDEAKIFLSEVFDIVNDLKIKEYK